MLAEVVESSIGIAGGSSAPGVCNPVDRSRRVRAVLFDVDGTLYRQRPVRAQMFAELARLFSTNPVRGFTVIRVLSEFRRAQETLRAAVQDGVALRQLDVAAERARVPVSRVRDIVDEWMHERPLRHLHGCRAAGLPEILAFLKERRTPAGVLSDYPADRKLRALGVNGSFSLVLAATDRDIATFKPHPRGFLAAAERWQLDPAEVLVVGDRIDADGAGAAAAGMPCVIVTKSRIPITAGLISIPSLERLRDVLDDNH